MQIIITLILFQIAFKDSLAKQGSVPYFVQFEYLNNSRHTIGACGGSLIDKRTVLSAAHCFRDFIERGRSGQFKVKAYLGSDKLFGGKIFEVDEVFIHPSYDFEADLRSTEEVDKVYERAGGKWSDEVARLA